MKRILNWIAVAGIVVFLAGAYGWIINLVTVFHSNYDHITGLLVVRVVGVIVAPIGAILGYF